MNDNLKQQFWDALLTEFDSDELERLLTAYPRSVRDLPLLAELIWSQETADPDLWSSESGEVLMRLAEMLLRHGADLEDRRHEGLTPMMLAAKRGNVEMVKYLIANGSILEARDDYGQNILHFAADGRDLPMMTECLDAGLGPNLADASGRTPLHMLVDGSYQSCPAGVALLLSRGASPHAIDTDGRTVLHRLARNYGEDLESLHLLLEANGNPYAVADDGATPWSIAAGNEDEGFCAVIQERLLSSELKALTISENEALRMLRSGQAGYYSFFADYPRPHPDQLCVHVEGQWFLVTSSVAKLMRVEHTATFSDEEYYDIRFADPSHLVASMVKREKNRYSPDMTKKILEEFITRKFQFDIMVSDLQRGHHR